MALSSEEIPSSFPPSNNNQQNTQQEPMKTTHMHIARLTSGIALAGLLLTIAGPGRAGTIERGGDISELTVEEQNGSVFQDANGVALQEPLTLCKTYGWTVARIRLFVNPPMTDYQVNTLSYAVNQAKRAKAQGMNVLLDFHYSDNWNNPGYHDVPAAWKGQSYSQLKTTVKNYTVNVMNTFKSSGVLPEFVQVGNEIGDGFLFPVGGPIQFNNRVPGPSLQWSQFIGLVKAGISGVKTVAPASKIMIHIPGGPWAGWCTDYFDAFTAACPNYDLVGISYYPSSTGSTVTDLSDIKATLNALHNRYSGKKLWITEFSYGWNWGTTSGNVYWNDPNGQYWCTRDLCSLVASYSDGGGVCYWGCFDVANDHFSYSWAGEALFDSTWYSPDGGTTWRVNANHRMLPAFGALAP
jgi:arabinogalactan endo-1,4-beta-galactosidase